MRHEFFQPLEEGGGRALQELNEVLRRAYHRYTNELKDSSWVVYLPGNCLITTRVYVIQLLTIIIVRNVLGDYRNTCFQQLQQFKILWSIFDCRRKEQEIANARAKITPSQMIRTNDRNAWWNYRPNINVLYRYIMQEDLFMFVPQFLNDIDSVCRGGKPIPLVNLSDTIALIDMKFTCEGGENDMYMLQDIDWCYWSEDGTYGLKSCRFGYLLCTGRMDWLRCKVGLNLNYYPIFEITDGLVRFRRSTNISQAPMCVEVQLVDDELCVASVSCFGVIMCRSPALSSVNFLRDVKDHLHHNPMIYRHEQVSEILLRNMTLEYQCATTIRRAFCLTNRCTPMYKKLRKLGVPSMLVQKHFYL